MYKANVWKLRTTAILPLIIQHVWSYWYSSWDIKRALHYEACHFLSSKIDFKTELQTALPQKLNIRKCLPFKILLQRIPKSTKRNEIRNRGQDCLKAHINCQSVDEERESEQSMMCAIRGHLCWYDEYYCDLLSNTYLFQISRPNLYRCLYLQMLTR